MTARARLPLEIRVSDDYGLTEVAVPFVWRGDDEQRKEGNGKLPLPEAKIEAKKLELSFKDILDLEPLNIPTATGLTFHVAASYKSTGSGLRLSSRKREAIACGMS